MSMTVTAETVHNSSTISSSESLAASPCCPPHSATRAGAPPAAPAASPSRPPHSATRAGAPPAAPGAPAAQKAPPKPASGAVEPAPSASSGGVRDRGSTAAPGAPAAPPNPASGATEPAPSTSSGGVGDRRSTAARGGKCRMKSCDHSLHSRSFGSAAGSGAGRSFGSSVPTRGCRHQIETSDVPTHAAHDRRHGFSQATA